MRRSIYFVCAALLCVSARAQQLHQPFPDLKFHHIEHWKKPNADIRDFRGKWLVMYAWGLGCASCVSHFPELNQLRREIADQAELLLVGYAHPNIRGWFEKYRLTQQLDLPVAYDTSLFSVMDFYTVPRIIIIDPDGYLRVFNNAANLNKKNLHQLFALRENAFGVRKATGENSLFDHTKPFLSNANGGIDSGYLFRSVLTRWVPGGDFMVSDFGPQYNWSSYLKNGIQLLRLTLTELYLIAYTGLDHFGYMDTAAYGKIWPRLLLHVKDTTAFYANYSTGKNLYSYSLIVADSLASNTYLQQCMQQDLLRFFPYRVQTQLLAMPVWQAVATRSLDHLRTKGGEPVTFTRMDDATSMTFNNIPPAYLFNTIAAYNSERPIVDCTGLSFNIDIQLDAIPNDINVISQALQQAGIALVPSTRLMKVIVITDVSP